MKNGWVSSEAPDGFLQAFDLAIFEKIADLQEETALQAALKAYLLAGNCMGCSKGVIFCFIVADKNFVDMRFIKVTGRSMPNVS